MGIWHCSKCDHTFTGGAWEPFTRASTANQRIVRRSVEGSSETDLVSLAAQAAMDYETIRAKEAGVDTDEEELNLRLKFQYLLNLQNTSLLL